MLYERSTYHLIVSSPTAAAEQEASEQRRRRAPRRVSTRQEISQFGSLICSREKLCLAAIEVPFGAAADEGQ